MKLKLQIGDEDSQRFDSGLVSGGSSAQPQPAQAAMNCNGLSKRRYEPDRSEMTPAELQPPKKTRKPVLLTRKCFAGRKGFFFAKSSRSSRLRGESWAGLSPRRREAREENAKDFSLVAALLLCETSPYCYHFPNFHRVAAFNDFFSARPNATRGRNSNIGSSW